MKSILACSVFIMSILVAHSQEGTYYVEYVYVQKSVALPDSVTNRNINVKVTYRTDSTEKTEFVEAKLGNMLPDGFSFAMVTYMLANSDSSKKFFDNEEKSSDNASIRFMANTPDTIFYKKGAWWKISDGVITTIEPHVVEVVETKESKDILGYKCIKFVSADASQGEEITFWACKDLPNTLLPFVGLQSFKYGILEIDHAKNKWHTKAVKIRKL